jgi:hypothetical protein
MSEAPTRETLGFRGLAEEVFEALADCFRLERLAVGTLGIALSLVAAAVFGVTASILLLRESLGAAAVFGVIAALALYAGLLVTFGAICRITMSGRAGESPSSGTALSFALWRSHILVGIPLFTLLVALAVSFGGGWLAGRVAGLQGIGGVLGPIAFIVLFALNLALICAVLLTHCLTGPCVACIDQPFAASGRRLIQIFQERLHNFMGYQAAVLLAGLPLIVLTAALFLGAFSPALSSLRHGRLKTEVSTETSPTPPTRRVRPEDVWGEDREAAEEEPDGWIEKARQWLQEDATAAQAPLIGAAVMLALLLTVCPLVYAAGAQSAVYLGLTGDRPSAAPGPQPSTRTAPEPLPEKHPPIVHCWRCDAINRFQAETCSKCGAGLAVCPFCFSANQPGIEECTSCGARLQPREEAEAAAPEETGPD